MRVAIFTVGMIVFSAGLVLQYGAWLIAWLSRLFGLHQPAATYADFVEGIATTMLESGFLRVMAPWALMAVGVTLLAVSRRAGHRNDVSP